MTWPGISRVLVRRDLSRVRVSCRPIVSTLARRLRIVSAEQQGSTHVSLDELGQVDIPNLKGNREREQFHTPFVDLEALLEVLVLFEERRVVHDDLRVGDAQLKNFVVDRFRRVHCADGLFEVDVE